MGTYVQKHELGDVWAISFHGSGAGITDIDLSTAIGDGSPNVGFYTNGSGTFSQGLIPTRVGGTGADLSASTGGLARIVVNTDGTFANSAQISMYGDASSTVPIRDDDGALHNRAPIMLHSLGIPGSVNREFLRIEGASDAFVIESAQSGSGRELPINIVASRVHVPGRMTTSYAPIDPEDVVRQADLAAFITGTHWQPAVIAMADAIPGAPSIGDRYIARATMGSWTINNIYEWDGTVWNETIVERGFACLVLDGAYYADQTIIFTEMDVWSPMGTSIDHNYLLNRGTNTHAQIDAHIGAITIDPHAGQDLRVTASPTHAAITLSSATSPWIDFTSALAGTSRITLDDATGALTYSRPDVGPFGNTGFDMATGWLATNARVITPTIVTNSTSLRVTDETSRTSAEIAAATHLVEIYRTTNDHMLRLNRFDTMNASASIDLSINGAMHLVSATGTRIVSRATIGDSNALSTDATLVAASIANPQLQLSRMTDGDTMVANARLEVDANGQLTLDTTGVSRAVTISPRTTITDATIGAALDDGALTVGGSIGASGVRSTDLSILGATLGLTSSATMIPTEQGMDIAIANSSAGDDAHLTIVAPAATGALNVAIAREINALFAPGTSGALRTTGGADVAQSLRVGASFILGGHSVNAIDPDVTLAADSDARIPTQHAVREYIDDATETARITSFANGFEDLASSTLVTDDVARTFTIQPTGASFSFWSNNAKFELATPQSIMMTGDSGLYYLYFNDDGVLAITNMWDDRLLLTWCYIASVYWASSTHTFVTVSDKRHGVLLPPQCHRMLTVHGYGTSLEYRGGMIVRQFTFASASIGSTTAEARFAITPGTVNDGDISRSIASKLRDGTIRVCYVTGPPEYPEWHISPQYGAYYSDNDGTTLCYNAFVDDNWQLIHAPDGAYLAGHIFAADDGSCMAVVGRRTTTSAAEMRALVAEDIVSIMNSGILGIGPFASTVPIASIVMRTSSSEYTNAPRAIVIAAESEIVPAFDWRSNRYIWEQFISHSRLTDVDRDSHLQYHTVAGRAGEVVSARGDNGAVTVSLGCSPLIARMQLVAAAGYQFASDASVTIESTDPDVALNVAHGGAYVAGNAELGSLSFSAGGPTVTQFDTDVTLAANSDTRLPTQHAVREYVDELARATYFNGCLDRAETTIAFVGGATHTFTIARTGSTFTIYAENTRIVKTVADESVTIDNTIDGQHYIYYNGAGTLCVSTTWSDDFITRYCSIATIYWNSFTSEATHFGDERHGIIMSPPSARAFYYGIGTSWQDGLDPSATIGDGSSDTHIEYAIAAGSILDADITHAIASKLASANTPLIWLQDGRWRRSISPSRGAFMTMTGAIGGAVAYNSIVVTGATASGSLVEVPDGAYVMAHIVTSNSSEICAVVGQATYDTATLARNSVTSEFAQLWRGNDYPLRKWVPIATIIYQYNTALTNASHARTIPWRADETIILYDWRALSSAITGTNVIGHLITSHGQLAHLEYDDHPQYHTVLGRAGEAVSARSPSGANVTTVAVADGGATTFANASEYTFADGTVTVANTGADALTTVGGAHLGTGAGTVARTHGTFVAQNATGEELRINMSVDGFATIDASVAGIPLAIAPNISSTIIASNEASVDLSSGALILPNGDATFAHNARVGGAIIMPNAGETADARIRLDGNILTFAPTMAGVGYTFEARPEDATAGAVTIASTATATSSEDMNGALNINGSLVARSTSYFGSRLTVHDVISDVTYIATFHHILQADVSASSSCIEYYESVSNVSAGAIDSTLRALNLDTNAPCAATGAPVDRAIWASFDAAANLGPTLAATRRATICMRIITTFDGAPPTDQCLFSLGVASHNFLRLRWMATTGAIVFDLYNQYGAPIVNAHTFGTITSAAANRLISVQYNLDTGRARIFVNNVQLGTDIVFATTWVRDKFLGIAYWGRDVLDTESLTRRTRFYVADFMVLPREVTDARIELYNPQSLTVYGANEFAGITARSGVQFTARDAGCRRDCAPVRAHGGAQIDACAHVGANVRSIGFGASFARSAVPEIAARIMPTVTSVGTIAHGSNVREIGFAIADDIDMAGATLAGTLVAPAYMQYLAPIDIDAGSPFTIVFMYMPIELPPSNNWAIFSLADDNALNVTHNRIDLWHNTDGSLSFTLRNNAGAMLLLSGGGVIATEISATIHDIRLVFAPTSATSGAIIAYIDGARCGSWSWSGQTIIPACGALRIGGALDSATAPAQFFIADFSIIRRAILDEDLRPSGLGLRTLRTDGAIIGRALNVVGGNAQIDGGLTVDATGDDSGSSRATFVSRTLVGATGDTYQIRLRHRALIDGVSPTMYDSQIGCNLGTMIFNCTAGSGGYIFRNGGPATIESAELNALNVTGGAHIGARVLIDDITPSTTTGSGALIVGGGAGFGGAINVGDSATIGTRLYVNGTSASSGAGTGCAQFAGGIWAAAASRFGGEVTFNTVPISAVSPTLGAHLVNKDYVDRGSHWHAPIVARVNLSAGDPVPAPTAGDHYIATISGGAFIAGHIYTYVSAGTWTHVTPVVGDVAYIIAESQFLYYNALGEWVSYGAGIEHQSLIGAGTLTHATIDSYLNQAVRTTSTPTFSYLYLMSPTMATGSIRGFMQYGHDAASINSGILYFYYAGSGSTNNYAAMGVNGYPVLRTYRTSVMVTEPFNVSDATASTSASTGCATFAGGIGVIGAIYSNNRLQFDNNVNRKRIVLYDEGNAYQYGGFGIELNELRYQLDATTSHHAFCAGISSSADQELMRIEGNLGAAAGVRIWHTATGTSATAAALTIAGGIGTGAASFFNGGFTTNQVASGSAARFMFPTMVATNNVSIAIGRTSAADECMLLTYRHDTAGSTNTYVSLGIYGRESLRLRGTRAAQFLCDDDSTSVTTGSIISAGGIGIAKSAYIGGVLRVTNTTNSTAIGTGCAQFSGGIYVAGTSYFAGAITCPIAPTTDYHLVNKAYVDSVTGGQVAWLPTVVSTHDFSTGNPAGLVDGARYISVGTYGAFTDQYIYTWNATSSTWSEYIPLVGDTVWVDSYLGDGLSYILMTTDMTWDHSESIMNHSRLQGIGSLSHDTIDGRLGQAVNTTSTVTFASMTLTAGTNSTAVGTGTIIVTGGASISLNTYIGGILVVTDTSSSTSTTSGCARFSGGIGVVQNAYIGGILRVTNTGASTSTTTGCAAFAGGIGVAGNSYFGGIIRFTNATDASAYTSGGVIISGGLGVAKKSFFNGILSVTTATNSGNTVSGCAIFSGGIGVAMNAYIGGILRVTNTGASTSTTTGCAAFAGGIGVAGNSYLGGIIRFTNTTNSTSTTSGGVIMSGGLGVAQRITATNMTCSTAPSAATDVVRLTDISALVPDTPINFTGRWVTVPSFATSASITTTLVKQGSIVTWIWASTITTGSGYGTPIEAKLRFNSNLPAGYRPSTITYLPVVCMFYYNGDYRYAPCHFKIQTSGRVEIEYDIDISGNVGYFLPSTSWRVIEYRVSWPV